MNDMISRIAGLRTSQNPTAGYRPFAKTAHEVEPAYAKAQFFACLPVHPDRSDFDVHGDNLVRLQSLLFIMRMKWKPGSRLFIQRSMGCPQPAVGADKTMPSKNGFPGRIQFIYEHKDIGVPGCFGLNPEAQTDIACEFDIFPEIDGKINCTAHIISSIADRGLFSWRFR